MAVSTADRLKRAKGKSKTKTKKSSAKELRVLVVDATHQPQIRKVCELGFLGDQIKSPFEQNKKAVQLIFFDLWTEEMFKAKKKPDNFRVLLPKLSSVTGKPVPGMDDVKCTFQLKFRSAGIAGKVPKEADLPEDQTLQEVIIETLQSDVVGLSADNAKKFVAEEIDVTDHLALSEPLDTMLDREEGSDLHTVGSNILAYLQGRTKAKNGRVSLPAFTDEQEEAALVTEQIVLLKDGVGDRIFTYIETIEQLRKLLKYCSVTLQVADFDFGMSDDPAAKAERLKDVVYQYLIGDEDDEDE